MAEEPTLRSSREQAIMWAKVLVGLIVGGIFAGVVAPIVLAVIIGLADGH